MDIVMDYIKNIKYNNPSKTELVAFRKKAVKELGDISDEKSDVFKRYTGVHGRFQQSQLDVLDIREYKVCAIIDIVDEMIGKAV